MNCKGPLSKLFYCCCFQDANPDAVRAAQLKMFGKLTHERVEWHPARMLCIRFNVKHPYGDYSVVGVRKERKVGGGAGGFQLFSGLRQEEEAPKESQEEDPGNFTKVQDKRKEQGEVKAVQNVVKGKDKTEEDLPEEEAPKKPPMDLFKSIFMDSSDDEDDEDKKDEEKDEQEKEEAEQNKDSQEKEQEEGKKSLFGTELEPAGKKKMPWEEEKRNILRNTNPAKYATFSICCLKKLFRHFILFRGIFANVDFDALNRRKPLNKPRGPEPDPSDKPKEKDSDDKKSGASRPKASDFLKNSSSEDEGEKEKDNDGGSFGPAKPPERPDRSNSGIKAVLSKFHRQTWENKLVFVVNVNFD